MADWNAFLKSDEFKSYRRKQAELIADVVSREIRQIEHKDSAERFRGKMEMAKLLMHLPESLTTDQNVLDVLRYQSSEDLARITQHLMREALEL